jgi:hypothetical protein
MTVDHEEPIMDELREQIAALRRRVAHMLERL